MFLHLKNILTPEEVQSARALLDAQDAPWVDGRSSAGGQALAHKRNEQLAQDSAQSHQLRSLVLAALPLVSFAQEAEVSEEAESPLAWTVTATSHLPFGRRRAVVSVTRTSYKVIRSNRSVISACLSGGALARRALTRSTERG